MAYIQKKTNAKGEAVYKIKVSCGYNSEGKQITKTMTYKPDPKMTARQIEKEVNKQAVLFEEKCAKEDFSTKKIKFKDLANEWLTLIEKTHEQKISSIMRLKGCRDRTYNAIGNMYVNTITYRHIQNFILSLSEKGVNQKTNQGLSAKTQKHYINFISDVMRYAIKCGFITSNPCKNISVTKTEKKEKDIYSLEELKIILATIDNEAPTDYKTFFTLMAYLGLRRGEVLGLEYKDFDFSKKTVSIIRTSNYRNKTTGIYTSTPKTKTSCRVLAIPDMVIDLVEQLQSEQSNQRIKCGERSSQILCKPPIWCRIEAPYWRF